MWIEFKKRMMYGGVTPQIYRAIEPQITKSNWGNLHRFSSLVFAAMLGMLLMSLFDPSLEKNRLVYIGTAGAVMLIMLLSLGPCRKYPRLVNPCVYAFQLLMLLFGAMLCTIIEPNEVAVSFVIILFVMPLLFTDRPIHICFVIAGGIVMYILMSEFTISQLEDNSRAIQIRGYNYTNILPYSVLSSVIGSYMMRIKIERFAYIMKNKMLSETDQMTGLLNRRSYSMELEALRASAPSASTIVCSIDVNGLKTVNDSMGHSAGDELICGAARCVEESLGAYGSCYRTGGDEFVVIIHELKDTTLEALQQTLQKHCANWHGRKVRSIFLSVGMVQNTEQLDIDDLIARADAAMYADKALYYEKSGQKRR